MNILKAVNSILFQEGIINYIKRKKNTDFLDNRVLFTINYNNRKTKIYLNKKFGFVDMYIFDNGIYEKEIVDDIRKSLSPEKTLLDIGSNIGQHSLLVAPYCKNIFAFEPIPDVYNEFQKSIDANHYKNIQLFNCAVGSKKETKTFNYVAGHAGVSSFVNTNNKGKQEITVQIDTLSNLIKDEKFDVIKLDVEGYEAVVIFGNKDIILKNRPKIFMEFCPSCIEEEGSFTAKELAYFFFDNNYEVFSRSLNRVIKKEDTDFYIGDNWILSSIQ